MKRMVLVFVLIVAACRTRPVPNQNPFANRADAAQAGAKLFHDHCAQCHGAVANGHRNAPSLRTARVQSRSDGALFSFLTNGDLRRGMPSWSRLPEERRWQIVAYLRSLDAPHPPGSGLERR